MVPTGVLDVLSVDYDVFVDVDVNTGESGGQQDHGGHEEHEEVVQPAL